MAIKTADPRLTEETVSDTDVEHGWRTVLFNCQCHTFDQVEIQLIKATGCSISRARRLSTEVDSQGSAVVFEGGKERCEFIADILGAIGLKVEVVE